MPEPPDGALLAGILTILFAIILRARAGRPRLPVWALLLAGIAAAYLLPPAFAALARASRAAPGPDLLAAVNADRLFIAAWTALVVLGLGHRPGRPPSVPLRAGLAAGLAAGLLLPPLLDWATGRYQPASLRADVNHCTSGMLGQAQPREVTNICAAPIAVGLCLPGEVNPAPCAQARTLAPGATARFDPGGASLASLPANPGGLTVVACRPPARPSRMAGTGGRGHIGVCLPPA